MTMKDYLTVEYSEKDRPLTNYPGKLAAYLFREFDMKPGMKLLEAGCGRGEFLRHFKNLGLNVYGLDLSPEAPNYQPDIPVALSNIEKDGIPFPDATFDVIYSKSLLEHFSSPEHYIREAKRVLKPGGLLLTLVPDWESNYKIYFDDFTHRTPFSVVSLDSLYRSFELDDIKVSKFRQLPITWKFPFLNYACAILAPFVPVRTKIPFFRWSRELMLVGAGKNPQERE